MAAQVQFCKSADGTRIADETWGQGDRRPLVVVAGVGSSVEHPYWLEFPVRVYEVSWRHG